MPRRVGKNQIKLLGVTQPTIVLLSLRAFRKVYTLGVCYEVFWEMSRACPPPDPAGSRIVFVHPGGYAVLRRPEIGGDGAEIPDTRHIGALATPARDCGAGDGRIWYKVVPFGEMEANSSDPTRRVAHGT